MTNQPQPEEWRKVEAQAYQPASSGYARLRVDAETAIPMPEWLVDQILRNYELAQAAISWADYESGELVLDVLPKLKAAEASAATFRVLVERLRQWDVLDTTADGPYWKGVIDAALAAHKAPA